MVEAQGLHRTRTPWNSVAGSVWVFSCLGRACVRVNGEEEEQKGFSTGIRLNVPDTVLFEDGSPKFWLSTHDGRLTKRDVCEHVVGSREGGAIPIRNREPSSNEGMSHVIEGMGLFWHRTNSKWATGARSPVCVVRFLKPRHVETGHPAPLRRRLCFHTPSRVASAISRFAHSIFHAELCSAYTRSLRWPCHLLTAAGPRCPLVAVGVVRGRCVRAARDT